MFLRMGDINPIATMHVETIVLNRIGEGKISPIRFDGRKELRQINMEFNARYVKGDDRFSREGCVYQK